MKNYFFKKNCWFEIFESKKQLKLFIDVIKW